MTPYEKQCAKNVVFDPKRYTRKWRYMIGAPKDKETQNVNYKRYQAQSKKEEKMHRNKRNLYYSANLRVCNELNEKVLMKQYGYRKLWANNNSTGAKHLYRKMQRAYGRKKRGRNGGFSHEVARNDTTQWGAGRD